MKKISYIGISLLLFAILPLPYYYYLLLRMIIYFIAGVFSLRLFEAKDFDHAVLFLGVLILFNPFFPIHLDKSIWIMLDVLTAYIFLQGNKLNFKKISNGDLAAYFGVMMIISFTVGGIKDMIYPPYSGLTWSEKRECEINEEYEEYENFW